MSIVIPTRNGAAWIREAIASALSQTWPTIEVLVIDDASTDETVRIAQSFQDRRVRIVVHSVQCGMISNWNHGLTAARGEFIKFLFQDDTLRPECVERLVTPLVDAASVGLSFCRRQILVADPEDGHLLRWAARFGNVHERFGSLRAVNEGHSLVVRNVALEPFRNWIGEPTAVLIRASRIDAVGPLYQLVDVEMWLRLMWATDVAFVDEPLVTIRAHRASATSHHRETGAGWIDPLWIASTIDALPGARDASIRLWRLRGRALLAVARGEVGRIARGRMPATLSRWRELGDFVRERRVDRASRTGSGRR